MVILYPILFKFEAEPTDRKKEGTEADQRTMLWEGDDEKRVQSYMHYKCESSSSVQTSPCICFCSYRAHLFCYGSLVLGSPCNIIPTVSLQVSLEVSGSRHRKQEWEVKCEEEEEEEECFWS
ncbi:hypothetical protein EYF80_027148 [Liparis tanakae]|uniref:Uncharacterized protein n=1 Tax=Liparis tanakae TaxID=230148 RepID=A0A4Z2HAT2_9TELE|nr:hypothetical protein EYF80_027148 [Liparis tanakae]